MAIKMDIDLEFNYVCDAIKYNNNLSSLELKSELTKNEKFKDVYISVDNIKGNKDLLYFDLNYYTDESKKVLIKKVIHSFTPDQNEDALRWDKQAYIFIKGMDEFKNALDA